MFDCPFLCFSRFRVFRAAFALGLVLVSNSINAADCARPSFADATVQRFAAGDSWRNEHFARVPGHEGVCAYALSWVSDRRDLQSRVNLYVASYMQDDSRKTADAKLDWEVDLLWQPPEVRIDAAVFAIHPDRVSFAVRTQQTSIASTVGETNEQFDLMVIGREGTLSRALSLASFENSYPRNCTGKDCEIDSISRRRILIVQPSSSRTWREILVRTSESIAGNGAGKATTRWLPTVRYRWGAEGYEIKP